MRKKEAFEQIKPQRNQAACLLGDGWTLPVIKHIFSFIKQ